VSEPGACTVAFIPSDIDSDPDAHVCTCDEPEGHQKPKTHHCPECEVNWALKSEQGALAEPKPAPELADLDDEPEALTEHLAIRFPADMIAAVKQLATAEGMTVSAWIRREVEQEAARREHPAPELAAMAETRRARDVVCKLLDLFGPPDDRFMQHSSVTRATLQRYAAEAGVRLDGRTP
jgi:hypothetical protein